MKTKLLFGGLGIIQVLVGCVFVWASRGHAIGFFGLITLGSLLVSGILKICFSFVSENVINAQRTIGGSFLLEGIFFGTGYQFLVEIGTYESRLLGYVLAALSASTLIAIGIGVLRDRVAFPGFFPEQS